MLANIMVTVYYSHTHSVLLVIKKLQINNLIRNHLLLLVSVR